MLRPSPSSPEGSTELYGDVLESIDVGDVTRQGTDDATVEVDGETTPFAIEAVREDGAWKFRDP